jgi:hypothetical protein
LQQGPNRPLKVVTGLAGHGYHFGAKGSDRLVKVVEDVGALHDEDACVYIHLLDESSMQAFCRPMIQCGKNDTFG